MSIADENDMVEATISVFTLGFRMIDTACQQAAKLFSCFCASCCDQQNRAAARDIFEIQKSKSIPRTT
jgi:hypothetical protein